MTIFGTDMSHYDLLPAGLGAHLVAGGISFATHKGGGDGTDSTLGAWWREVAPYRDRLLLGAYWVLRPDLTPSAAGAAAAFLARLDGQCPGWRDGPFILQADCEEWGGRSVTQPRFPYISKFCDYLASKVPSLLPIVYASAGQYGDSLAWLDYPLWNARYSLSSAAGTASALYTRALAAGSGWGAYSGQTPAIWQFSSSATIAGLTTCDANAYRGTLDELTALIAPGWENNVAITTTDLTNIAQAVASKLHTDISNPASGLAKDQAASEARIVAAVKAGIDVSAIAAAIPTNLASGVIDALAARLAA